jgi:hypothetical protein
MNKLGAALLLIAAGFGWWTYTHPRTILAVPTIVTVYDTVEHVDTLWKTKLVKTEHWDTVLTERVVTAKPETVYTSLTFSGMTQVMVPGKRGDSTKVLGLTIQTGDSGTITSRWQVNYWTKGPLRALSLDTFPPRISYSEPPKTCNVVCSLKKYGLGILIGAGTVKVFGK